VAKVPIFKTIRFTSGTDVMILKIFSPKISAKKLAFLTRNKAKICEIFIITLVFEKNANFFAENCQKSQKIVIITSTPGLQRFVFLPYTDFWDVSISRFALKIFVLCFADRVANESQNQNQNRVQRGQNFHFFFLSEKNFDVKCFFSLLGAYTEAVV
jgi:hypothetical protein